MHILCIFMICYIFHYLSLTYTVSQHIQMSIKLPIQQYTKYMVPWNEGVVMVCMKMGDRDILKYSLMGLPNLTPQMWDARKDWVKKNVDLAEKHLLKLEELNKESYGETDESHRNYAEEMPSCQEDSTEGGDSSDAWQ